MTFDFITDNPRADACLSLGAAVASISSNLPALDAVVEALRRFQPQIQAALDHGGNTHAVEDIVSGLFTGHYDLLFNDGGAAIFELNEYPNRSVYHAVIVVGELDAAMSLHEVAKARARALGATRMTMNGRLGWQKVLPKYGWKPVSVVMELDIGEVE